MESQASGFFNADPLPSAPPCYFCVNSSAADFLRRKNRLRV